MDMGQFKKGCLPGNLTEVEQSPLDIKRRKDLVDLMLELEDLKNEYQRIIEKKERLANLMKFYNGSIITEQ